MLRTLTCITQQHNPLLLAVAVLVCLVATATTLRLYSHGQSLRGSHAWLWLVAGGISGGAGIWATHFVAMLAYEPGLRTGYEPEGTIVSLLVAGTGVAIGLIVAARTKGALGSALGGTIVGLAIAAMHYAGMSAFRTEGFVIWNLAYVGAAIASGLVFAPLALIVASGRPSWRRTAGAAVLMVLAIVGVHFISMAAVTIVPNTRLEPPASVLPNQTMAAGVGLLSALIMISAGATLFFETRTQRRTLAQLNSVIEAMPDGIANFDAQDRYLLWNAKYETSMAEFGLTPERGRSYIDCVLVPAGGGGRDGRGGARRLRRRAHCPPRPTDLHRARSRVRTGAGSASRRTGPPRAGGFRWCSISPR